MRRDRGDDRLDDVEVDQRPDDGADLVAQQGADADADDREDDQHEPGGGEGLQVVALSDGAAPRAPA